MSELEKKEIDSMESQDTCSESLEATSSILDTSARSNYSESQDFHLVDPGDEKSDDSMEESRDDKKGNESVDNAKTTSNLMDTSSSVHRDTQEDESTGVEQTQSIESCKAAEENEKGNDNGTIESEDTKLDENEDIIECTPPAVRSPLKKQVTSNAAVTGFKRKAGSFEEPPTKLLKTESKEDISNAQKIELDDNDSSHSDDSYREHSKSNPDANVIIAETQDVDDNEGTDVKDTDKAKDVRHSEVEKKDYETCENENFNDSDIVAETQNADDNDARTIKDTDRTKDERHSEVEMKDCETRKNESCNDTASSVQFNENRLLPIEGKEKDSSSPLKIVTTEKIKSDTNTANTDCVKFSEVNAKDPKLMHTDKAEDKENDIESVKCTNLEQNSDEPEETPISKEITNESHSTVNSANVCKARKSIELIYDRTAVQEIRSKPKEIVEIDEDGEKIVLDSSQDDSDLKIENKNIMDNTRAETIYKSCYDSKSSEYSFKSVENTKQSSLESAKSNNKLVNGSSDSKRCDTDSTASLHSDTFSDGPGSLEKIDILSKTVHNVGKQMKLVGSKDSDHGDLLSVSDNEPDVFMVDEKSKSHLTKGVQVEREIGIYVRMKCLLNVDEGTKEFLNKEITGVQCECVASEPASISRQKNNDTSASLADISGNDNKDVSPGSVNSNPQLYQLNPSRLSFASTISSLSSASSAASLAAKLAIRDNTHFSLPRAPARHAKKQTQELHLWSDKQAIDEAYERLSKEWHNSHLLTATILNFANAELSGIDTHNISSERIDDQLQKIRCSTPEIQQELVHLQTPKSTKKSKSVKRPRSKNAKPESHSEGSKTSLKVLYPTESNSTPNRKKSKVEHTESTLSIVDIPIKPLPQMITDELIGKEVFAKWSDNNYYPGKVVDKVKMKYKVNFYDGKSKVLIEDFVIPIPPVLKEGLSVYATSKNDDYGSCGIITDTQTVNNEVFYMVETDEGEKIRVQIKNIFLSMDQAQVLKEEIDMENKSLPSTPKHLGQVTLDNMVDGKRRSKRIATPVYLTPKAKMMHTPTSKTEAEPSVSGMASKLKKEKRITSESEGISSDSNVSMNDEMFSIGIQPEIIGTPYEQIVKGPQNRIKSKSRSKKKVEDEETIAMYGPIPQDSNLFKGMSFILTCASVESIDRFQDDIKDNGSDPGTENEEEWVKKPFIRDRLNTQIIAGGGKVYTDFNDIPKEEYKNTKLITNVPNTTAKTLQCLSVGIPAYNHNWIIRCCQEGKIVNSAEDKLPAGWSLEKNFYVEMYQRPSNKPLTQIVVIIPVTESNKQFVTFWRQICENVGAVVLLAEEPDTMESFVDGTVVLTNSTCPSWAVERAKELDIPLLSATWIVQCIIEGKLCEYNSHLRYKYNYKKN